MLNMQTALKWSLVMLVNKVNFGEWVKRQRNYQNKTKNKNRTPHKTPNHSHVHSKYSSVSPVGRSFQANKTLTEHMALH